MGDIQPPRILHIVQDGVGRCLRVEYNGVELPIEQGSMTITQTLRDGATAQLTLALDDVWFDPMVVDSTLAPDQPARLALPDGQQATGGE